MLLVLTRVLKGAGLLFLCVLVMGAVAWGYWGYSPIPDEPALSSMARTVSFEWDGRERSYVEYIPANLPEQAPLLVVLHGSVMNGDAMRIATGYEFDRLADQKGYAVIYPVGYLGHWNDCRNKATFAAKREQIDDTGFILALIGQQVQLHRVDPQRVFVMGYSNGGQMAFRLGGEAPHRLAGIAVAAASLPVPEDSSCAQEGVTPRTMLVNGMADRWNPYAGGEVPLWGVARRGSVMAAPASAQAFAERNGIVGPGVVDVLPDLDKDGIQVMQHRWERDGEPYVMLYSIEDGGHVIPQPVYRFPRMYGFTSDDLNLPQAALAFFGL